MFIFSRYVQVYGKILRNHRTQVFVPSSFRPNTMDFAEASRKKIKGKMSTKDSSSSSNGPRTISSLDALFGKPNPGKFGSPIIDFSGSFSSTERFSFSETENPMFEYSEGGERTAFATGRRTRFGSFSFFSRQRKNQTW